jgi:diketogulonate reductase-like aldo/keto reductase
MIHQQVLLNNGVQIPKLGLGTYKITDSKKAYTTFEHAIDLGYRHFDTAALYQNEKILGEVIRSSGIHRRDFFITTKLWNDDQGFESALGAYEKSNAELGLDYIDLYLIHWPVKKHRQNSWKALEKIYSEKRVRAIGVSNYMANHLNELLSHCEVFPAVNQIELSPFNYLSRADVKELCQKHGTYLMAYCPLTRGLKLQDPRLIKLAANYAKSPAQILIKWGLQRNILEIPKSGNIQRITENADVFNFDISAKHLLEIDAWDENLVVSWDPTKAD